MDTAPLIKAHDHAKAASDATQTANSTVAINEHTRAAGEFSLAAKSTSSIEALRTLRLLEQHHQKLSELIKFSVEHPANAKREPSGEKDVAEHGEKTSAPTVGLDTKTDAVASTTSSKSSATVPGLSPQRRYPPARELSSSIANNLASARGIRGSRRGAPAAPSISNEQAPGNLDTTSRKDGSKTRMQNMLDNKGGQQKPSWVPPVQTPAQATRQLSIDETAEQESPAGPPAGDEGFSRFYNTFGNIINTLSAPLAFAGLPLIAEEHQPTESPASSESSSQRRKSKSVQTASDEPDLNKIYSKAALRSIYRDGHNPTDSFYVVPTSGHTVSYASILNFDQKEKRRAMAASIPGAETGPHDLDEDDFVDARESQMLPAGVKRRVGKSQTEKGLYNVIEELNTENTGLKDMLDKVTKRLAAFEASAQHSRLAMVDSMRLPRPASPLSQSGGTQAPASDDVLRRRNRELEEELARAMKQFEALEKDNNHLQRTVDKYRKRWQEVIAGAKERREKRDTPQASEC
ncbi:unnamed protein product [Discula destructiva]